MADARYPDARQNGAARDAWAQDGFAPLPGDTISLPDGDGNTVQTVYLCSELSSDTVTRWTWVVFGDDRLLEIAPRGCALYAAPRVLKHGTGRFLELGAQDGALVRFEERVRSGTWEARPVHLTLDQRRWRLTSTGTVTAQRLGAIPTSAWGQLGGRADDDVYFTFAGRRGTDALGLGLWATDICVAFGRRLGRSPAAAGLQITTGSPPDVS